MSDPQIKPIKINPELFSVTPRNKNKTLKKSNVNNIKPNKLKHDLLTKIKNYRQNKQLTEKHTNNSINNANNSINNANNANNPNTNNSNNPNANNVNTVNTVNNPKKSIIKNSTISNDDDFTQSINFLKDLSLKKQQTKSTDNFPLTITNSNTIQDTSNDKPLYSSMKNGSLPTYREWKNKTLKKQLDFSNTNDVAETNVAETNIAETNIAETNIAETNVAETNIAETNVADTAITIKSDLVKKKPSNKSTTLKYYLGKRGRTVGILIKNAATRKNIVNEHNHLKQTKISDMKKYLKRHNLLKSGSQAPPDVVKKLYEQSLLGGDIRNSNKTSVIHNYLAE